VRPFRAVEQTGGPDEQTVRARAILAGARPLTTDDVAVVQAAVRAALAGKYVVKRLPGDNGRPLAEKPGNPEDEYLLDDHGRVRFYRYLAADTAWPGRRVGQMMEFTGVPAVRCSDRTAYPGRRLAVQYVEDRNGWRVMNVVLVDDANRPWASEHPASLLDVAAEGLSDAGTRTIQARRARGLRHRSGPREDTLWLDPQSLLPLQTTLVMTMDGKRMEFEAEWRYPRPRPLGRPAGVTPPDCI
jgi:hypothetical protein